MNATAHANKADMARQWLTQGRRCQCCSTPLPAEFPYVDLNVTCRELKQQVEAQAQRPIAIKHGQSAVRSVCGPHTKLLLRLTTVAFRSAS